MSRLLDGESDVANFIVSYLVSGATLEDLDAFEGEKNTESSEIVPNFTNLVAGFPNGNAELHPGETAVQELVLKTPREHFVACFGCYRFPTAETQLIKFSDTGVRVSE